MTTAADDTADEAAFEAFLAGRPVFGEAADLAAFAGAVRATATEPGRPNAALAELLSTGLLTDQSTPSTRTAPSAGSSPRRSRVRRRRRFAMFFPALLAKFLSAGAFAQAATGAGVVLVVATGAGAAGVLPEAVQDTFASVVGTDRRRGRRRGSRGACGADRDDDRRHEATHRVPSREHRYPRPERRRRLRARPRQVVREQITRAGRRTASGSDGRNGQRLGPRAQRPAADRDDGVARPRAPRRGRPTPRTPDESDASETAEAESGVRARTGGGGTATVAATTDPDGAAVR